MKLSEIAKEILGEDDYEGYLADIASHIEEVISYWSEDEVKPLKLYLFGSRLKGTHRKKSDLDALFLYDGSLRSKYLQDALNDDLDIGTSFKVDISPVNSDETGYLSEFNRDYDVSKLPTHEF